MAETSSSEGPSLSIGAIVGFFIVVAVAEMVCVLCNAYYHGCILLC